MYGIRFLCLSSGYLDKMPGVLGRIPKKAEKYLMLSNYFAYEIYALMDESGFTLRLQILIAVRLIYAIRLIRKFLSSNLNILAMSNYV